MEKLKASILFSFRAKVIVPVIVVMVLLMTISMWLVNRRITRQLEDDAAQILATADAVLKNSRQIRAHHLLTRYRNVVNEPRFKALATLFDPNSDSLPDAVQNTVRGVLEDLIRENVADVIVLASTTGEHLGCAQDPWLNPDEFAALCRPVLEQALDGRPAVDMLQARARLFDLVGIPIRVGQRVAGVIVFGVENSMAAEFKQLTRSDLVLISGKRVLSTTLDDSSVPGLLLSGSSNQQNPQTRSILIGEEHFLARAGILNPDEPGQPISYFILSSYERALQALHSTQRTILFVSGIAILLGATVVWILVRRVTQPLRELCDSAEAVGKGDFSRRVQIRSKDECAELAHVFNRMTENLKTSHEQLAATVARLKTTQAQLIQSEKLSGIGEFVAGVAHELNNPLTSVMGFSELLKQNDLDPKRQSYVDMIVKSSQRCHKIVQALLSFARRHQPERKLACVNAIIESSIDILRYQLRTSNIEIITRLDPKLPEAMVDTHQLQQVFVNLLNNARQAIEAERPSGWIRIKSEAVGSEIVVTFSDNGPGIPEENLPKLFDPFFTTKEVGKGTGLGLSLCYGIIKEHGGTISPSSPPGAGAVFVIRLPVSHEPAEPERREPDYALPVVDSKEGVGRRVLVIDDEEPILHMVQETLSRHGYTVDTATDGETGLNRLRQTQYDVTLCDWKMPGLNGQQVHERLRAVNPELAERMIFITGDLINDRTRRFFEEHHKVCLPKPFTVTEFRSAIQQVLTATSESF